MQRSEERCEDIEVPSSVPSSVPKAKRKATKATAKSPSPETPQTPHTAAIRVVGADGVPLKRCVGKRKVGAMVPPAVQPRSVGSTDSTAPAPASPCHESQETKESPEEHVTPPPKNTDPQGSGGKSKKPKGKARAQSSKKETSKPDEPQAQSLEKAFAEQAELPGESPKVKKLKIVKSKAKTKAEDHVAGDTRTTRRVKEVDQNSRPKGKTFQGMAQVPIRRLLVKRGSDDDEVVHVEKDSRPKWKKKLLRMGKGGKRLDIEDEKPSTLEACFAGKRKAEVPAEAEASKKGLLSLGFHPVGKEQNEAANCKESMNPQQEANDVEVVDLESKQPRFDWKQGFAKLSIPTPQTKASKEEGRGALPHQAPVAPVAPEPQTSPASSPKGASKLSKQGSKDLLSKVAKVDWCERHAPTVLKQLKPQKAWQDLRDWLKCWRPNRKGREAAIVTGPCGSGKTAGVRYLVRKWHGQFMEYDFADAQGRSFFENLAKKQRNGNQLSDEALSQVLVCNISEQITAAQKECLALAVQASPSPIIFSTAEGIFGAKDAIHKMCLEIRISLTETFVAKQIHEISQREQLELPLPLCHTVANACRCDLRKALQSAQLLSVLSGSGQACLPQAACAPMTACERLLRNMEKELSFEDAMSLIELDDEVPMLLRWNLLPSLSFAWTCRRRVEEVNSFACSEADTLEAMDAAKPAEVPREEAELADKERSEAAPEAEKMDVDAVEEPSEAIRRDDEEPETMDVDAEEPVDVPDGAVDAEEGEKRKQARHQANSCAFHGFNEQELQDLETCARMTSLLALSDVTGHLALQAAEQAGPTVEDLGVPCVAAEPLLLAIMSREAHSFGASSQTAKKHFQPTKFLQDPVCPISMDQVAVLAMQLDVPKAWVLDRIYDWIAASRTGAAGQRNLKNFRSWLKRQVQLWHQRQGRCLKSMGVVEGSEAAKSPADAADDDTLEVVEEPQEVAAEVEEAEADAEASGPSGEVDEDSLR